MSRAPATNSAPIVLRSAARVLRAPLVLAVTGLAGIVAALLVEGASDVAAASVAGAGLWAAGWAALRQGRRASRGSLTSN